MKKEERRLLSYDFTYFDGKKKEYLFQTIAGVSYEAGFKPGGYIFTKQPLDIQQNVFECYIAVVEKPAGKLPAPDNWVPDTIAAIFHHFFKSQKRVAVYICDISDMRASVRMRKFNQWYEWYKGDEFFKVDLQIGSDSTGQRYFTSVILHLKNPDAVIIIEAFRNLILSHNK